MHRLACALVALAAAASPARADDDEDPDGAFEPFPTRSVALGIQGHGTHIDGKSESGAGATLELAYGRGRWQYMAEGAIASSTLATDSMTATRDEGLGGHVWRGALGGRWLARQFMPDGSGGIELFLLGEAGMEHYHYAGGSKLTRPDVALGFGIQGRGYHKPRFAFRLDLRVLFTGDSSGFLTGMAFAW